MPRLEVELTSARPDGSWTWRKAGARQPKGEMAGTLLPADAQVGDVLKVEADVLIDGIEVTEVIPTKTSKTDRFERIELAARPDPEQFVSTQLAPKGRGDRGDRGDRPRRDRDSGGPGRDGRGREGRGAKDGDKRGPRTGSRDDDQRGPRSDSGARRPRPPAFELPERPKPKRIRPGRAHRTVALESLPPAQRATRLRTGDGAVFRQAPTLALLAGKWQITMPMGDSSATARAGEPLHFAARTRRADQDWLRLPVTGINRADAEAYVAWLDHSQKVPGARLCSELEWERAARGADGRKYPTGEDIAKDDANFDETYDRKVAAMGPDEVGSHPASESPFGLHDTFGNVWEWVMPSVSSGDSVVRGGAFFFDKLTSSATNRNAVDPEFRDGTLGLRVCATPRSPT